MDNQIQYWVAPVKNASYTITARSISDGDDCHASTINFAWFVRWPERLERQAEVLLHETVSCDALHELLALTSVPVRYDVIPELSTTLLLGLNHANKMTRLAAVRHLATQLTHGQMVCRSDHYHHYHCCRHRQAQ